MGKALKMWRGQGDKAFTHYSCEVVEQAKREKVGLQVVGANGKLVVIPAPLVRLLHRPDITGVFSSIHSRSGEGKYIASAAWQGDKTVVGAQHVVPYLAHDYCYASIVQTFLKDIGTPILKGLRSVLKHARDIGDFLVWQGKRTVNDCVAASRWMTRDEAWDLARKLNPTLSRHLGAAESQKKGVKGHSSPKKKFFDNINVMRRARRFHNPATGHTEYKGGAYPFGMPLEHVGYAIDYCFLTDGFVIGKDAKGNKTVTETGEYYLRMVVGRSTPWVMLKNHWAGCSDQDRFAFKSEEIRQAVIEARKRLDKTQKVA